jgi:hypothetical protein
MSKKLKKLEIQKILQEYSFLRIDGEYKETLKEEHIGDFLKQAGIHKDENEQEPEPKPVEFKREEKAIEDDDISKYSKLKIKNIYREIVKLTHPDKTDSEELNEIYIKAKKAKEKNDLLELYFICGQLHIDIDLDKLDIKSLNKIIEKKKEALIQFEKSYIWAWANAKSDEERDALVEKFNKNRK